MRDEDLHSLSESEKTSSLQVRVKKTSTLQLKMKRTRTFQLRMKRTSALHERVKKKTNTLQMRVKMSIQVLRALVMRNVISTHMLILMSV